MRTLHVDADLRGEVPELDLALDEHNRIVVRRPVLWRPHDGLLEAWPRSAVAVPAPWTSGRHPIPLLLHAVHRALDLDHACVIVAGWTAASGESPPTAGHRARATEALVHGDAATWVSIAAEHGSLADVLAYLDHLHRRCAMPCPVETISPEPSEASEASIAAFQAHYNAQFSAAIDIDGVCGEQTLDAVFAVLRFEWERWCVKYGLSEAQIGAIAFEFLDAGGLDRTLAAAPTESDGGIDVLVLEKASLGGRALDAAELYGSAIARLEPFEVAAEPGGWSTGPYTVITDVVRGEEMLPEIYNLRAVDGSYAQSKILPDEGVDNGFLELRFIDVPCDKRYRLDVEIVGVGIYEIFADLAYGELHAFARSCGKQEG
jgi:hypothetical protein